MADIFNNYERLKQLGNGAYGSVWQAKHRSTGTLYAMKEIRFSNHDMAQKAYSEAQLLYRFSQHPHILQYVACAFEGNIAIIVTELCEGSLQSDLVKRFQSREFFEPIQILTWWLQLASALVRLHENGIMHRDIKPPNILLKNGQVKLADLGIATNADAAAREPTTPMQAQAPGHTMAMGTPEYMVKSPTATAQFEFLFSFFFFAEFRRNFSEISRRVC